MKVRVKVPKLGLTIEEVTLTGWEVTVGTRVEAGAVIATIEADKASYEIVTPVAGTLIVQNAAADTVLAIGAEVGVIET